MEHRIKCSAWNKVLAYIRVKLTDILLRFNITSSYIFRIFLQNQDNVMHGYSFYPKRLSVFDLNFLQVVS